MQRIPVYVVASLLSVFGFGSPRADVSRVEEESGRVLVEVRFDVPGGASSAGMSATLSLAGLPAIRYERFYVALPPREPYRVTRIGGESEDHRGDLPKIVVDPDNPRGAPQASPGPGFYPQTPVVVSEPFIFRRTRMIAVDCYASQVDYTSGVERRWKNHRVEVAYSAGSPSADRGDTDPIVSGMVINASHFPAPAAGTERAGNGGRALEPQRDGIPDPHFSLSSNWVKISVDSAGIYSITGNDLVNVGVSLAAITDPASFRLFTRGGREVERRDASGQSFTDLDGTWLPGNWMTECDMVRDYGGDGTFDPTDRIIFYAVGAAGWSDMYDSTASRDAYHDHLYAKQNAYYLTWDDAPGFAGEPRQMVTAAAAPVASESDLTTFEDRLFFERNLVQAYAFGGDGWVWANVARPPKSEAGRSSSITLPFFQVHDLVTARPQTLRTLAMAPKLYDVEDPDVNKSHHAVYWMNAVEIGEVTFSSDTMATIADAAPVQISGTILQEGTNVLRLSVPRDLNSRDFMYFELYEMFYSRRLRARGDEILFTPPDTTGTVNFRVRNFSPGEPVHVFDVSDPFQPRVLDGYEQSDVGGRREVRFSQTVGDNPPYLWAGTEAAFRDPASMVRFSPKDLRDVTTGPHMLIICHPNFRSAANRFKNHRESHFPYAYTPDIKVVSTDEVYDNFSGGLIDPMGIRNYCKFLYDNFTEEDGSPRLEFLLLLGDANMDFKNYITPQENFVTTNLNLAPTNSDPYATDDWFAELEPRETYGAALPQIAVGRLPAGSPSDASLLVDRIIGYETKADFDPWRDRVILVADDEKAPNRGAETDFIIGSEAIAYAYMAPFLEPAKIYLTEYPTIGSAKPASRADFLEQWNNGALMINYIGHGNSSGMADEQVFLGTDVANLRNGLRLPLFMAFSCTIGDFGRAQASSLAERLVLWEAGGAIGAITASEVTYVPPNSSLNGFMFQRVSPRNPGSPNPMGVALLRAKIDVVGAGMSYQFVEENNQKYNLLGDPSLPLASPRHEIAFVASDVDTFTAGKRATIRGSVQKSGSKDTGFSGSVNLVLREPDDASGYTSDDGVTFIPYRYPGGTVYRGTADVTAGSFEFSVKIPRYARTGPLAFVRAYAENGVRDAAVLVDESRMTDPSPEDITVLTPLDGAPRTEMGFEGGQTIVKPGAVLEAKVNDADGINILNTTPEGKIALLFDKTNLPLDVTESFEFDDGGTDTSGVLSYPMPDLPVGRHQAVLKVADSFGQVRLDTLTFTMTDPIDYAAQVVLNYPNPFASSTYFLVNLTDPAEVELNIFTVSGKKVRTLREREAAGEAWILWDGKDSAGDAIANGTYLYVARVSFVGLDRTPVVLRGKVVKIE